MATDDESRLFEERERFRITLASIGDAVISTDAEGRVVFMNSVAEELTGWPQAEALGRPLPEVFHIVNEATRLEVENPALRALREGKVVGLANHTVLIARDGIERPIDDSAAPMRDGDGRILGAVLVFRDVTERKQAEVVRARLAAIVESSDDAIVSKNLDGIIQSWNAGAQRVFGYRPEEAIGKHITLIIPPELVAEEAEILRTLRRGERVEHFETVRLTKDGRRIDVSLSISPVKDADGRIIGASKIGRDITERKRAEAALRSSEERHRFLANLARATQPLVDPDQVMATTARLLAEHLGVDRCAYAEIDYVEGEAIYVIIGDYSRGVPSIVGRWPVASFGALHLRMMLANEPYVIDDVDTDPRAGSDLTAYRQTHIQAVICMPLHKAGRFSAAMAVHQKTPRHWTREELELVRTVVGLCWEALERTRVTRGLRETADHLALAMAAANLGDWSWDIATDLVTFSPRAAEIFGIPPTPQMTWTQMQARLHDDDRERARQGVEQAVATGQQYNVEYRVLRPGGAEVWVSAQGRAHYDPAGKPAGMFGMLQDITEKKRLEQELRHRAQELAEADRKKDDFIALLAHELRNPLAPLRTGLQVIRLAAGDAGAVDQARAMMDRQLSHMVRLIDDLLDISRINRNKLHLQKSRISLSEVVSQAIEAAGPTIEAAGHALHVSLPPSTVALDADLTRLAQVLVNLLSNSAKYMERGGNIWLSAELRGDHVIVSVRDSGIGIPAHALPHIFDMFSQVERSVERSAGGLGIGLSLVKRLVEMHGGTVQAESAGPGAGSTFRVCLPAAVRKAEPSLAGQATPAARSFRAGRKVLVVDDHEDGADLMATMLTLLGSEVRTAHDGEQAVELAESFLPDLILMDVGMPRLNGLDATRKIRAQPWGRAMTIVALTGWGQEKDRERTRDAGCDGHLVKPVNLSELEKLLADLARPRGSGG